MVGGEPLTNVELALHQKEFEGKFVWLEHGRLAGGTVNSRGSGRLRGASGGGDPGGFPGNRLVLSQTSSAEVVALYASGAAQTQAYRFRTTS